MIVKKIDEVFPEELRDIILRGGVVVYPTDTIYGLLANPFHEFALRRVFHIKKRSYSKPLPLFVDGTRRAKTLAYVSPSIEKILNRIWPGQVTVVLRKRDIVPRLVSAGGETVGLRVPARDDLCSFISFLDLPLTGTSANISDDDPARSIDDVVSQFSKTHPQPDLVVDGGVLRDVLPSTVVDATAFPPKILRRGPLSKTDIETMFQKA